MSYKVHVFICTNSPDNPNKCGSKNSEKLRAELKEKVRRLGLQNVRINGSGCLGACEKGIATVIYPRTEWTCELTEKDCDLLLEKIQSHLE